MGVTLKKIALSLICVMFCLYFGRVDAQVSMTGGKGLFRVLSAEPVTPADIFVNATASSYVKKVGAEQLAKYYCGNVNATIGLANYMEAFLNIVPYQDDQIHILGRFGDTRLGFKYLTPLNTAEFKVGLLGFFKFPTAEIPNVLYEVFSTNKAAWGVGALMTFDLSDVFPTSPLKLNFNFSYMDHNMHDRMFKSKIDQFLIGSGFKLSVRSVQVFLEYSGEIFFNNPGKVDFSQNSMRITPGVRFLGPWRNTIDLAFDIGITKYDSLKNMDPYHKEYSGWKFSVGVTHRFSVYKYFDKTAKLERQKRLEELRKLEEIRKKRENANQDLERMKKILDKKKSKGI